MNKLGDFVLIEDGIDYLVRGTGVTSMRFFVGKRFLYGEPSFDSGDSSVLNRRGDWFSLAKLFGVIESIDRFRKYLLGGDACFDFIVLSLVSGDSGERIRKGDDPLAFRGEGVT